MVAKNDIAHRGLVEQLMAKSVKRKYVALVHGNI
jgi:23S rRNA pseudouridine1911/1915/1917 synthase